jgi:hypothetical protein
MYRRTEPMDRAVAGRVAMRLVAARELEQADIVVCVSHGKVTLEGWVEDHQARVSAEGIAAEAAGVVVVRNLIRVRPEWGEEKKPLETEFANAEHAERATSVRWRLGDSL